MNYYDPKIEDNSQNYQCFDIENLFCMRTQCESEDLDLGEDVSIFEGSPVLCDSELIGFVSKGIYYVDRIKVVLEDHNYHKTFRSNKF